MSPSALGGVVCSFNTDLVLSVHFQGKVFDKSDFMDVLKGPGGAAPPAGGPPRLRSKGPAARARPKTIHVDSGALQAAEGMLGSKQPSSTNLTGSCMILLFFSVVPFARVTNAFVRDHLPAGGCLSST